MVSITVVFLKSVDCSVLYKVLSRVKCGEEYLIEGLDGFFDILEDAWKFVVFIGGKDIKDVIDDIDLVALVDIFTGISDIISGAVFEVVIGKISDVVPAVDMSTADEDGVNDTEMVKKVSTRLIIK